MSAPRAVPDTAAALRAARAARRARQRRHDVINVALILGNVAAFGAFFVLCVMPVFTAGR